MQQRSQTQFRNEQEDIKYQEWLAKEDDFMLIQAKKRAVIRVREGRAKPIDSFVINLKLVDEGGKPRVLGDDELEGEEFYITEPDDVIKDLSDAKMSELKEDIQEYLRMEKSERNQTFWTVCWFFTSLMIGCYGNLERLSIKVKFSARVPCSQQRC